MKIRTYTSPFALAAVVALSFGSAGFAQTMIGDQEVGDGDLAAVKEHCAMLAGTDSAATDATTLPAGADGNQDDDKTMAEPTDMAPADAPTAVDGNVDADTPDPADAATAETAESASPDIASGNPDAEEMPGGVNLQQITLAECEAAGM